MYYHVLLSMWLVVSILLIIFLLTKQEYIVEREGFTPFYSKIKCSLYLRTIEEEEAAGRLGNILKPLHRFVDGQERIDYPSGCALCQFDVPCMAKNPMGTAEKD